MRDLSPLFFAFLLSGCLTVPSSSGGTTSGTGGTGGTNNARPTPPKEESCESALPDSYTFYFDGGFKKFREKAVISPPRAFALTRTFSSGESRSCKAELSCEEARDAAAALADPEVQKALSPDAPFFGQDGRPRDIPAFTIEGPTGKLQVGQPCPGLGSCTPIPEKVQAAVDVLKRVGEQQRGQGECAALPESL